MSDDRATFEAPFAEALTAAASGDLIGYRLQGCRPGPTVLIAAAKPLLEPVSTRIAALPTLPWIRGTLLIVDIDAIGDGVWFPPPPIDATLTLLAHHEPDAAVRQGYWSILRVCARLGMIEGRGVAPSGPPTRSERSGSSMLGL